MSSLEEVDDSLARLKREMKAIGVDKQVETFPEWANGHVLLSAKNLRDIMTRVQCSDYGIMVILVSVALRETSQHMLIPTLGLLDGEFVIYLIRRRS